MWQPRPALRGNFRRTKLPSVTSGLSPPEPILPRHATRIPLYVPALAKPGVRDAWVVNVSATGMALVCTVEEGADPPAVGSELETEFSLPQTSEKLHVRAKAAWVELVAQKDGARGVTMGLAFLGMTATDRSRLAEHIAAYRPVVVLALATAADLKACEPLENDLVLQRAATREELREVLGRGDLSAVVVFGEDEQAAVEAVEEVALQNDGQFGGHHTQLQLRPSVIYAAAGKAERLLRLHNEGKLFESLERPFSVKQLASSVQRATQEHALRSELQRASHELERARYRDESPQPQGTPDASPLAGIIYTSQVMRQVISLVEIISPQKLPVLLLGETGTGKELFARAVHGLSERSKAPFVVQDCGVLAETLLESELFGHVKGAFTGAISEHPGLFRVADRGTIFLDEIENTTPALQAKLLRAIESGEVRQVGGTRSRMVDVRVVAASNRNLLAEVDAGRFRADLYYRLSPFPIELPPLRERREDVMPLAHIFLRRANETLGRTVAGFTNEAEAALIASDWKGNVRELRNVVERAVLLTPFGRLIGPGELPEAMRRASGEPRDESGSLRDRVMQFERKVIREALERHGGVLRRAALELGTNPMTFARRAKQLGVWPLAVVSGGRAREG